MSSEALATSSPRLVVAITGASGIPYGLRLVEVTRKLGLLEAVIYSQAAEEVARHEHGIELSEWLAGRAPRVYRESEMDAPYASSSRAPEAMVIAPCSMRTLAAIAHGIPDNLITRAALAVLRMRRRLVLVVRETPLGVAELRNMLLAAENGAVILPASPGFYHGPKSIQDMVDFIVGKILDVLGVSHGLYRRWRS